jgi:hypothetical protein
LKAPFVTVILLGLIGMAQPVRAQQPSRTVDCRDPKTLNELVFCRIQVRLYGKLSNLDPSRQSEAPSITTNSTTLADKSAGPDVLAASINPSGLSGKSQVPQTTDASLTATLYGVYSTWRQREPFNPAFYEQNMFWRRLSVSIAPSYPQNAAQIQQSVSYGAKFLVTHPPDPLDPSNRDNFAGVSESLRAAGGYFGDLLAIQEQLKSEYQNHSCAAARAAGIADSLNQNFDGAMAMPSLFVPYRACITAADVEFIDDHTADTMTALKNLTDQLRTVIKNIETQPQASFSFLSKISQGTGSNLYRSEFVMDRGWESQSLRWKLHSTTNASFDFSNSKTTKPNKDTFRLVEALEIPPIPPRNPVVETNHLTIGVSGEGDWGDNQTPTYKAQGKLKITAINGFDIPISVTYANQTGKAKRADVKLVAGFAFDFAKLLAGFRE